MAAAMLDDWDSTVDQYGYRMLAGDIAGRGRALLAGLPAAQRASRAGRELRALLDNDATRQMEDPA